ncbi:MAG: hypothetical protein GTN38_03625 [Candidatus Aenigmarchaeota archaeon]|nr:hypothetical protein [Candidatus Aenigmarchaeota archaeon]NIP40751.1 hypothetical protein [Candidatus Aenigmarchaeota archaeon]NIQ18557.1 hypothetical protein [Candidatus Aenigmarchaeota archaeon]NIS73456.1 hypothetical protein [Candidatus Aenigmarchaeota archaeon]
MKYLLKNLRGSKVALYGLGLVAGGVVFKIAQKNLKKYPVNPKKARKNGAY